MTPPPPPPPPPPDAADPLAAIVDDETPRREALEWAVAELEAGATFDALSEALAACGWGVDDSDEIVELARRITRPLRGGRNRQQVVAEVNRHHRHAGGRWFVGFPAIASAIRLIYSVGSLLSLRRQSRRSDDPPPR